MELDDSQNQLFGGRKFYEFQSEHVVDGFMSKLSKTGSYKKKKSSKETSECLLSHVHDNIIGRDVSFSGPYGPRKVIYCDYIASGRSLKFIEDFISEEVLPYYGNTHTTTTVTSMQSTLFRHEARDVIRNAVNASEEDSVIFVGHGCTGAVHKLIHSLNLRMPPVVFVSMFEHHSNLLPWRELGAELVCIQECPDGRLDVVDLEEKLKEYRSVPQNTGRQFLGCMSAASNITGIITDVDAVSACLHKYNALAFFDYATAGPYCEINMNPLSTDDMQGRTYKDAVFISTHKFVGGPGTPGILVAKKHCFRNPVPYHGGGGSVFYVTENTHRYLQEVEMREEGGTPAIVESIRAGMVFQLKEAIGHEVIMAKERELTRLMFDRMSLCPNVIVLGGCEAERLPILSFVIKHPDSGRLLHHNFVCAVLNDLFGIQARAGCACAGPYAQKLLGMSEEVALQIEHLLLEDQRLDRHHLRRYREYSEREILRPGFVRLNLPYFMPKEELEFVFQALSMVSSHAWKLLPQYIFNPETGEWRHRKNLIFKDRKWLGNISYKSGRMAYTGRGAIKGASGSLKECLQEVEKILTKISKKQTTNKYGEQTLLLGDAGEILRWFLLPSEAALYMNHEIPPSCRNFKMPFSPGSLQNTTGLSHVPSNPLINYHLCSCSGLQSHAMLSALRDIGDMTNDRNPKMMSTVHEGKLAKTPVLRSSADIAMLTLQVHEGRKLMDADNVDGELVEEERWNKTGAKIQNCVGETEERSNTTDAKIQNCVGEIEERVNTTDAKIQSCVGEIEERSNTTDAKIQNCVGEREERSNTTDAKIQNCVGETEERSNTTDANIQNCVGETGKRSNTTDAEIQNCVGETGKRSNTTDAKIQSCVGETEERSNTTDAKIQNCVGEREERSNTTDAEIQNCVGETEERSNTIDAKIQNCVGETEERSNTTDAEIQSCVAETQERSNLTDAKIQNCVGETEERSNATDPKVRNGVDDRVDEKCLVPQLISKEKKGRQLKFHHPPKAIFAPVVKAIEEFDMIHNGDRVLLCLSGGKDSLSMLHTIHQYQCYARAKKINFDIGAMTVDPQSTAYNPRPLKHYLRVLNVPYFYEEQDIIQQAADLPVCESICSFCSRMKRGRIYACARREGYNVIALGQHLDDLAESFLMSVFHNGLLRTMKANYLVQEEDLRVIRPLVYVRERDLRSFAEKVKLPVIPENCPACFESPKERHRTKQLLAQQEVLFPNLFSSILTSIKPLMAKNKTGMESSRNKTEEFDEFL